MLFENIKKTKENLYTTDFVVENYILFSAKLQTSHNRDGTSFKMPFGMQGSILPGASNYFYKKLIEQSNPLWLVAIMMNSSRINPIHRNRRYFSSMVFTDGNPQYTVSIRYRMWQSGQFGIPIFRRLLYGFGGQR